MALIKKVTQLKDMSQKARAVSAMCVMWAGVVAATAQAEQVVIDVRTPAEFAEGHVEGAVNIPFDTILKGVDQHDIKKDDDLVLYCRSGRRAGIALDNLKTAGFEKVINVETVNGAQMYLHNQSAVKF